MIAKLKLNNKKIDLATKKVGLALSGGGYRAAFFHLGVLARLAELDILKHINVISTVSGGSIIGALYYLKLKERLSQEQPMQHSDYINLIMNLEGDFVRGVSKNIRSKIFLHPLNELYSVFINREKILGNLYAKYFRYSNVSMAQLKGTSGAENLPKLIINATLLGNGGHYFFSDENMGQYIDPKIVNSKGIIHYSEHNQIFLKDAVAASSAVPGLFNYVNFKVGTEKHKVVDGGAFDNLGIYALQKEVCDLMIISDGSRQISEQQLIPRKRLSVLKRSYDASLELNKKLMLETSENFFHIHLREGHPQVDPEVSDALSRLRTDLNNFNKFESWSLSNYGYLLTDGISQYLNTPNSETGEFVFKNTDNTVLMQLPNRKFKNKLWSGEKINTAGSNSILQTLNQLKLFLATFLVFFLIPIYFVFFAASGIIPGNNPVVNSYIIFVMYLIGFMSIYLMIVSSSGDLVHYLDYGLSKLSHFILSVIYIFLILATILLILSLIIVGVVKII
ncbi:hypothetical protein A8709_08525 [Paenibacillus pectinilyticus]|uniref:PNPLA domain-containing protein n=1 Tax=Paenibacillus pectinilyticus TaxID=512399 RepID=A0A1C1A7X0_9BACL|nr:patatin-like phospholipase family protein [Paenibacillus pectinilyticus]OCT16703.1 hypothetical protein A8709_08525 [Paenibacillus pectinilyticus]